jgi:hypothetical protein
MVIRHAHLAPLLVAAGAAAAIMLCPNAIAQPDCTNVPGASECSSPGNVQINATPTTEPFTLPYWDEVFGGGAYTGGPYPVPYAEGSR